MTSLSAARRAALIVAVEGATLTVLGAGYAVAALVREPYDRAATLLEAGFALVAGVLLLLVARGLWRTAGWSRAPAVVVQLLALPVGVGLAQGRVLWAAVPVLLLAGAALYQLATPEARSAFAATD